MSWSNLHKTPSCDITVQIPPFFGWNWFVQFLRLLCSWLKKRELLRLFLSLVLIQSVLGFKLKPSNLMVDCFSGIIHLECQKFYPFSCCHLFFNILLVAGAESIYTVINLVYNPWRESLFESVFVAIKKFHSSKWLKFYKNGIGCSFVILFLHFSFCCFSVPGFTLFFKISYLGLHFNMSKK